MKRIDEMPNEKLHRILLRLVHEIRFEEKDQYNRGWNRVVCFNKYLKSLILFQPLYDEEYTEIFSSINHLEQLVTTARSLLQKQAE
jgi:hypothetical protein